MPDPDIRPGPVDDPGTPLPAVHADGSHGVQVGSDNIQLNIILGSPSPADISDSPPTLGSGGIVPFSQGHAFISYVREDSAEADALQALLVASGIRVWRDITSLWPGEDWRAKIRAAITGDALVFLACFSRHSAARRKSSQNEELLLAIDQLRQRHPDDPWLIPVRFDDSKIPDFELGAGRTLASLQRADLFGPHRDQAARQLMAAIHRLLA